MKRLVRSNVVLVIGLILAACGPTPTPEVVEVTRVVEVEKPVEVPTEVVTEVEEELAYVEDQVLVLFDLAEFDEDPEAFIRAHGTEIIVEFPLPAGFPSPSTEAPDEARAFHLLITDGTGVEDKVSELVGYEGVFASPNYFKDPARIPNDPLFGLQWELHNTGQRIDRLNCTADEDIDAPEMWNIRTSCSDVRVAVIDSGADVAHPDLAGNIGPAAWDFVGEDLNSDNRLTLGSGEDCNGNGVLDEDASPEDLDGHGTSVTGVIGAVGNNGLCVAGVCWAADLLIIRVADDCWQAHDADFISAYLYAVRQGAKVVNASFGGPDFNPVEFLVLWGLHWLDEDWILVAAAGNEDWDNNTNVPGDRSSYPASYRLPDLIISVGASDCQGDIWGDSNYGTIDPPLPPTLIDRAQPGWGINEARWGLRGVDLVAPGVGIVVLRPMCGGRMASGTSLSAPLVSGVAALVWAQNPALNGAGVKRAILANADFPAGVAGWTITGGRLNGFRALITQLPLLQQLQMLCGKLAPGVLAPGWNIKTIRELLLEVLRKMREEGMCGLELDELIEAIERLPDNMPDEGISPDVLEKLDEIIGRLAECSVAPAAPVLAYGQSYEGVISTAGEVDRYTFRGESGDNLIIDMDAEENASKIDTYVVLRDSSGQEICSNDDADGRDSFVIYELTFSDEYIIEVHEWNDDAGGDDYFYTIKLLLGGFGMAWPMSYGDRVRDARISDPGEIDYYAFTGSEGDVVTIDIDARVDDSLLDSLLIVRDWYGYRVAQNDDDEGLDSKVTFTVSSDGDYLIEVHDLGDDEGGDEYYYAIYLIRE